MKARTILLTAGTIGVGAVFTRMMRKRTHELTDQKAKRPGWRKLAGLVGTGIAFRALRRWNA